MVKVFTSLESIGEKLKMASKDAVAMEYERSGYAYSDTVNYHSDPEDDDNFLSEERDVYDDDIDDWPDDEDDDDFDDDDFDDEDDDDFDHDEFEDDDDEPYDGN